MARQRRRKTVRVGPPTLREQERAALKLQGLFRTRHARRRLRLLTRSVFEKVYDPSTGAYFFHNKHTGDVSWTQPKILGSESFDSLSPDVSATMSPHDQVSLYRQLAKNWQTFYDETSQSNYYFNLESQETTWLKPKLVEQLELAIQERDAMMGDDWSESCDDQGNYFFFNKRTQESSWEPPQVDFRNRRKGSKKNRKRKQVLEEQLSSDESETEPENDEGQQEEEEDDDSEPPEAIEMGENWKETEQMILQAEEEEDSDDDLYISSDEETSRRHTLQGRKLEKYIAKRERQELKFTKKLTRLEKLSSSKKIDESESNAAREALWNLRARLEIARVKKKKSSVLDLNSHEIKQTDTKKEKEGQKQEGGSEEKDSEREGEGDEKDVKVLKLFSSIILQKNVKVLDLGFNRIEAVSPEIKCFRENLEKLTLDSNVLICLPIQLWYCANLTQLDVRNNRLKEFSREKGNMQVLRDINLWEIGIEALEKLEILRMDGNLFQSIPEHVGQLAKLKILTARNNLIHSLPSEGIGRLVNLTRLDLSKNKLVQLPDDGVFASLSALKCLSFSHNSLESLPSDFGRMENLEVLDVSFNNLTALPSSFYAFKSLQCVNLSHNQLEEIPNDWESFLAKHLRVLDLSHNKLRQLPVSLGSCLFLQHLDASFNKIRSKLPERIGNLPNLKTLKARGNQLQLVGFGDSDPKTLLPSLVLLDLAENSIQALPAALLFGLPKLVDLNLSQNALKRLDEPSTAIVQSFGGVRTPLRNLNLSNNQLSILPKEIFTLTRLRAFKCSANTLSSVPSEVGELADTLEVLQLGNNKLRSIPRTLELMKRLTVLDLVNNLIESRPDFLESIKSLISWDMSGNPIKRVETAAERRKRWLNEAEVHAGNGEHDQTLQLLDQVEASLLEQFLGESAPNSSKPSQRAPGIESALFSRLVSTLRDRKAKGDLDLYQQVLWKRTVTFFGIEEYSECLLHVNRALSLLDLPDPALLYYRAVARYRGLNQASQAVADLDKVLTLREDYFPAYLARAMCLIELGHYEKALQDTQQVLNNNLFDADAYLFKGLGLERMGKLEEALEVFRQGIEHGSEAALKKTREKSSRSENSKENGEPVSLVQDILKKVQFGGSGSEGSNKQAGNLDEIKKSIDAWSPLGTTYYRMALVLRDLSRSSEAVTQFQVAAELLCSQRDHAIPGSLRAKKLGELYRLAVLCKSSVLQSLNRTKKAMVAFQESREIERLLD